MYDTTTRNIQVNVEPLYLEEESIPEDDHFVWAYKVTIQNQGSESVKLLNRYWKITDALGRVKEVNGSGVVGEQPVIGPGDSYEYMSGAPLPTPSGLMLGKYEMVNDQGESFNVDIPPFSLDSPYEKNIPN
ncbi:Co2+/Mg2+ efflux protein ApaG [Alphaproteobacteria bacterium]|nr:Co2+/Mg2+ efflux protein ApaG [Alphaproteobacteria bacterium]